MEQKDQSILNSQTTAMSNQFGGPAKTDVVVQYLSYLRDVSRKIVSRQGLENVLHKKAKQSDPCFKKRDEINEKYIERISALLDQQPGKGLFIGFGLIVGSYIHKGRKRSIAAPLLYAQAEPDLESGRCSIAWSTLSLNYDLLTLFLEAEEVDEEVPLECRIPPEVLRALARIEDDIDNSLKQPQFKQDMRAGVEAKKIIQQLQKEVSHLGNIVIELSNFDHSALNSLVSAQPLRFYSDVFCFVTTQPDQLTTAVALKQLIDRIKKTGLRDCLLVRLLNGVLERKDFEVKSGLVGIESIRCVLNQIPISLSERQRTALLYAWDNEISYIQGPPGTGKSHTITALLMSAVFLKKSVLVVSHKKPAVEVVYNKFREYHEDIGLYLGPTPQQRKELRSTLQSWIQSGRPSRNTLERTKESHNAVAELLNRRDQKQKQLDRALDAQREYYDANERFNRKYKAFIDGFDLSSSPPLARIEGQLNYSALKNMFNHARTILDQAFENGGRLRRRDWLRLKVIYSKASNCLKAEKAHLKADGKTIEYLVTLLEVTEALQKAEDSKNRISSGLEKALRKELGNIEVQLEEARRNLLRSTINSDCQAALTVDAERFDKMLYWKDPDRIETAMEAINFASLIRGFPIWLAEMRDLGRFLPFNEEMFDLVIVDEASQVNIAEIVPAFFRGRRICVVGDKKQLGLNAAGLFSLNKTFEDLIWNRHLSEKSKLSIKDADDMNITVSRHSILDFITSPSNRFSVKQTTINEHFRSFPRLAAFTSDNFYADEGGLCVMTEQPRNMRIPCFHPIRVNGVRNSDKIVPEEVDRLFNNLRSLILDEGISKHPLLKDHIFKSSHPSIGVISFLNSQRRNIIERIEEESALSEAGLKHQLFVGTPEDFQGNERDIIFITLGLDASATWGKAHYENPNRFNVATSRAKHFTFVIYGDIPQNARLIKSYLSHFDATWRESDRAGEAYTAPINDRFNWRFNEKLIESKFEHEISDVLAIHCNKMQYEFYNQVEACGQKRLDFVVFNPSNSRFCAIEVDGPAHYVADGKSYSEAHLERVEILKRGGWRIVHVPYYQWWRSGHFLSTEDPVRLEAEKNLVREIDRMLLVDSDSA